jgi:two-component system LytT family response regulator
VRTLLVDDEPLARRELRRLLASTPWVEIVGEAANVDEAETQIATLDPELVLLDVQMPGGSGFDLLGRLNRIPQVIFTTAYDQHAVRAFEVSALDYLLKPIDPRRLATALARVRRPDATAEAAGVRSSPSNTDASVEAPIARIFIRDGEECWLVRLDEVCLLASDGNYIRVHWRGRAPMLARSLVSLEARLDPRHFFRANRHQIIHLDFVESIEAGVGGRLHVRLRGGPEVEISRRQARLFQERLGTGP